MRTSTWVNMTNASLGPRCGIRKGGLKNPDNAQISLGMCLYNEKDYNDAIAAFREAGKTRAVLGASRISGSPSLRATLSAMKQIRLAEAAARKQAEELAKRREQSGRI